MAVSRPTHFPHPPAPAALAPAADELRLAALAGLFGVAANLLILTGPAFMLLVYDRVLPARSPETLVALTVLMVALYLCHGALDHARGRLLARLGARLEARLARPVFDAALAEAARGGDGSAGPEALAVLRGTLAAPIVGAVLDLPFAPLFLAAIFLFHPALGWLALAGGAALVLATLAGQALARAPAAAARAAGAEAAALAREALAAERAGLGRIGRDVRPPWQQDGRRWHLEQRTSRDGKPVRWEPAALEYVEQVIQKAGRFAPTNWSERASVEITASGADDWFFHALTGGEWLLDLYFHVPRGRFDAKKLDRELALPPLDDRADLPVYGSRRRVELRPRKGAFDAIAISVHDRREIDTPAFRRFVRDAAAAYLQHVARR